MSRKENPMPRIQPDVKQWALAIIAASRHEFNTLLSRMPAEHRSRSGQLKDWSPKDEIAHLAYWIDLFAHNIQACREAQPLTDTRDYRAMNDAAWPVSKDWSWDEAEAAVERALTAVAAQVTVLDMADLTDPQRCTLEPHRKAPRPLIQSLLYDLVDHPLHHFVGLYRQFGDAEGQSAMLTRLEGALRQPGVSKWTATTRRKIQNYRSG
jgi:hypothetical protein